MIVCMNSKEAKELKANLLPTKETILIHEEMKFSEIQSTTIVIFLHINIINTLENILIFSIINFYAFQFL